MIYFSDFASTSDNGGDYYWNSVVFLAGWESGLTDESPSPKTVTSNWTNPARISGIEKFGSWGVRYDLSIERAAHVADSADWDFGTSPFTVEGWFSLGSGSGVRQLLTHWDFSSQKSWSLQVNSGGNLCLVLSADGSGEVTVANGAWSYTTATYYHVAGDFDGTYYRTYVNGVMIGKTAASAIGGAVNIFAGTAPLGLGHAFSSGTRLNGLASCNVDEARITKGVARYASDSGFAAPSEAFPRFANTAAPSFSVAPSISNNAGFTPGAVGDTYTATPGTYANGTAPTYQWKADGVDIGGATGLTFTATGAESGKYLTFAHTVTNSAGSTTATSASVGPVISGATYATETVTMSDASTVTLSDASNLEMYNRTA